MVGTRGTASEHGVTEVDEAAQRDEREEDRLFEPDGVRTVRLLLQQTSAAHMRSRAHRGPIQENGILGKPALELDVSSQPAVLDRHRGFGPEDRPGGDDGTRTTNPAPRMDDDTLGTDEIGIDVVGDVDGAGIGDLDPLGDERLDGCSSTIVHQSSFPGRDV